MVKNFVNLDLAKNRRKCQPILSSDSYEMFYQNNTKNCGYSNNKQATLDHPYRKELQSMSVKGTKFSCAEELIMKPSMLEKKIRIIDSHLDEKNIKRNIKLKIVLMTELGVGVTMIIWGIIKNL
tara:strand:+ start:383 stop:754 length:372 start_codon:yes stop_codon:yes gene_type:complete